MSTGFGYNHRRWRRIRRQQLRIEPLCRMCAERGEIVAAEVVDHIEPHKGDRTKFFTNRLQSLCAACHDGLKQQVEHQGFHCEIGPDGWPTDPAHPINRGS